MRYFDIATIKSAIERLQSIKANWLLPAFVFAANDVRVGTLVDIAKRAGTDQFLDRYFNGNRLGIPTFPTGNNLLRPRLKGIAWDKEPYSGDYMLRQDTKAWGNLFSSRGYREMRLQGLIDGEKTITALTSAFQPRFEAEIDEGFHFEDFLVWLYAFEGFPNEIDSWQALFENLLHDLGLAEFAEPYRGRFKLTEPPIPWPATLNERPTNEQYLSALAPKLQIMLAGAEGTQGAEIAHAKEEGLSPDDIVLASIRSAMNSGESLSFLLAGPPGTGKTRYARDLAKALTDNGDGQTLFLQFHPALGYDDFIEGFRPVAAADGAGVRYELAPRIFLKFANDAAADKSEKPYVAVIDELNRADVARVFGEVLTYLEADYRNIKFSLPVSGDKVALPKNLVLIATANPFDRSVTDMDDALLRRFWVIEFEPDAAFLRKHLEGHAVEEGVIKRTVQMFTLLNEAFPHGYGHTNFLRVRSVDDLASVWIGRVRLALKRAFAHDKVTLNSTVQKIEELLKTKDGSEEAEQPAEI